MTAYGPLQSSLNAATAAGAGTVVDLGVQTDEFLLYYTVTGTGSANFKVEASLDNVNWFTLFNSGNVSAGGVSSQVPSGYAGRYFQATLNSVSGSPVVTAAIAAAVC